ncbi:MAG: cysteine peptidase family C39 domain-containing protein [Planctomycetota bacterium]|jgi:hypothetical protein
MKRKICPALVIVIMVALNITCPLRGDENSKIKGIPDCGPQCVRYLSRYFYRPITLQEAYKICEFDEGKTKKTNLLQIKRALEKLDLYTFGFKGQYSSLLSPSLKQCAFIVWVEKQKHFVVIARAQKSANWLWVDPSLRFVYPLKAWFFSSEHSGIFKFLAVSKAPIVVDNLQVKPRTQIPNNSIDIYLDNRTSVYDVNVGAIQYGISETKTLRIIPTGFDIDNIGKLKRDGCETCGKAKIQSYSSDPNEGHVQYKYIVDEKSSMESGPGTYKDNYTLLSREGGVLAKLTISHDICLSDKILPNKVVIECVPGKTYTQQFHKKIAFTSKCVHIDNPELKLEKWSDDKQLLRLQFKANHTYMKNSTLEGNVYVHTTDNCQVIVPLLVHIDEYIEIDPLNMFLGTVQPGQQIKRYIDISSTKTLRISKSECGLLNYEFRANKIDNNKSKVEVLFTIDDSLSPGPLKTLLKIHLHQESVSIPIHGFVKKE